MNHERQPIKSVESSEEQAERAVSELTSLAQREIILIDNSVEQIIDERKKNKARALAVKFKEAIYFYSKLIIAAKLTLGTPSDNPYTQKPEAFEEMIMRAREEIKNKGTTREQESTYIPIVNNKIYEHIFPHGYNIELNLSTTDDREMHDSAREDAWRLYLGLPQKYNTFDISNYQPGKGSDSKYYFKIKGFTNHLTNRNPEIIKGLVSSIQNHSSPTILQDRRIMGHYKIDCGQDEKGNYLSYYDRWDLDIPMEKSGLFGKPFEIYDRIYYKPDTFELLDPPEPSIEPVKMEVKGDKLQIIK